jgi:hypothetical protein
VSSPEHAIYTASLESRLATAETTIAALNKRLGTVESAYAGAVARIAAERRIAELERQIEGHFAEHHEVTQALGKALNYPREGPEVGGDHSIVCVGEHTPGTIAQEAARRIAELEATLREIANYAAKRCWDRAARALDER